MRVTNTAIYRQYTSSVNDVHSQLNKSMNKISSGKAYESAAENPLAYYSGQRMDTQYQDVLSKKQLLEDVDKRLYQQEQAIRTIQSTLATGQDNAASKVSYILNTPNNEISTNVGTIRDDLIQKQQSMINNLNGKYESFYVFGGNDLSTTPFALTYDSTNNKMVMTYSHKFSGDDEATEFKFQLKEENGEYTFKLDDPDGKQWDKLKLAMEEQGRVDVGYGSIHDTKTLIDTYTGGMNVLTNISSDSMRTKTPAYEKEDVEKALANSAIGILGQGIITMNKYMTYLDNGRTTAVGNDETGSASAIDKEEFHKKLGGVLDQMQTSSDLLGRTYSDLGNKSNQLENTLTRLEDDKLNLETQYQEKLGADPYEAIVEMFSYQRSYTAALQVSSKIMGISLFDFMR
ncbi:MAG: flagellar hook-basal body protein [Lachnospiraceae bacterium]|nr:flagellar hook-basal body protein [Lachnospiraceae bacterium]